MEKGKVEVKETKVRWWSQPKNDAAILFCLKKVPGFS
jgi:hypothetical protein